MTVGACGASGADDDAGGDVAVDGGGGGEDAGCGGDRVGRDRDEVVGSIYNNNMTGVESRAVARSSSGRAVAGARKERGAASVSKSGECDGSRQQGVEEDERIGGVVEMRREVVATKAHVPTGEPGEQLKGLVGSMRWDATLISTVVGRVLEVTARVEERVSRAKKGVLDFGRPRGAATPRVGRGSEAEAKRKQAIGQVKEGRIGDAARTMMGSGEGVDAFDDGEFAALFPKSERAGLRMPRCEELQEEGMSHLRRLLAGESEVRWTETVWDAIRGMQKGKAPGVSGLRVEHLVELATKGEVRKGGNEAERREEEAAKDSRVGKVRLAIAQAVDGILSGRAPDVTRTVRLRMIPKPKGGSRPLGVGETMAKVAKTLVAKALVAKVGPDLQAAGQFGVATDGCHVVARAMQAAFNAGKTVAAIDVRNAFNSVEREEVVAVVEEALPQVSGFIRHGLGGADMVTKAGVRQVDRGVVQGDPTSSVLFAMVVAKVLKAVATAGVAKPVGQVEPDGDGCMVGAYADDITVAAKDGADLKAALGALERGLNGVGLTVERKKTQVLAHAGLSAEALEELKAAGATEVNETSIEVLGVPVGTKEGVEKALLAKVRKVADRWELIEKIGSPMAIYHIVRGRPVASQLQFVLTGARADAVTEEVWDAVRALERRMVEALLGMLAGGLTDEAVEQAYLPIGRGGLGLRRLEDEIGLENGAATYTVRAESERDKLRTARADALCEKLKAAERDAGEGTEGRTAARRMREMAYGDNLCVRWFAGSPRFVVDEDRDPVVEAVVFARLLGVGLVRGRKDLKCRDHRKADGTVVYEAITDGIGFHGTACKVHVQNGRHNAARDELFAQLRSKVPRDAKVWKEVSAGVQHEVRQRKYGSAGRDETVGGDVAVVTPKKRTMIDVVVRAYAQRCILSGSKLAVERAWDDKEVERTRKDGVSGETTPFGMTDLGSVHVQSVKAIRTLVDRGHIGVVSAVVQKMVLYQAEVICRMLRAAGGKVGVSVPKQLHWFLSLVTKTAARPNESLVTLVIQERAVQESTLSAANCDFKMHS